MSDLTVIRSALMSGFNSHYVITLESGYPPERPQEDKFYDEIVVAQEYRFFFLIPSSFVK